MFSIRAIAVWLLIIVVETINGILRQLFIIPLIGDLPARQLGVFVGSLCILLIAWASYGWVGARNFIDQMIVGFIWVLLMVIFEISLGLGLGYSFSRIASDYNLLEGGFMLFGLLILLFAPFLASRVRGKWQ